MLYIAGCILITAYLTISLKLAARWQVNAFQAIVFNYITCVITGSLFNGRFPLNAVNIREPWFKWAVLMGGTFIFLFNIVAFTSRRIGVAITAVAYKLSLVIPFLFSIWLYSEKVTFLRVMGVVIALLGVYFTVKPPKRTTVLSLSKDDQPPTSPNRFNKWLLIWPVILFAGSGLLDTMIKYVEQEYLNAANRNDFLVMAFVFAAAFGIVLLAFELLSGRQKFNFRSVLAGIAIGLPNYFSIWFMVAALKQYPGNSSAIIPIINMGIVLSGTLAAVLLFRERLSALNYIGIILSLGAIALIAFG
jgi:drug/metabolite transporter (DMT)-like permease